jgi:Na+-driven multidrug efflux pump
MNFIIGSAFQGAGKTGMQLVMTVVRWILIVGIAYALVAPLGLNGIWMGFPVGNFFAFLVSFSILKSGFWLRGWTKKPKKAI